MNKNKLFFLLIFLILLLLVFFIYLFSSQDEASSIAVLAPVKDYHMIDADGDEMKDVILVGFEEDSADIVLSLKDSVVDLSEILPSEIALPFYIFVYDINLDDSPEVLLYDVKKDEKNTLYIYDRAYDKENSFHIDCDYLGLIDNGYRKQLALLDDNKSYVLNPLPNGNFIKSSFPALSVVLMEKFYKDFVHTGLTDSTFIGSYFSLEVNDDTLSFSPASWHTVFKKNDNVFDEYTINVSESSVSIVKN